MYDRVKGYIENPAYYFPDYQAPKDVFLYILNFNQGVSREFYRSCNERKK